MKPPIFSCLTSRVTNTGSLYGRFLLGPLPIDISLTVATILRRSLLHTKTAFAIVSAEIEGANHEYASLAGVQESVLEILLNLGEIVLASKGQNLAHSESQSFSSEKVSKASLESSGFISQSKEVLPNNQYKEGFASGRNTNYSEISTAFLRISGPCIVTAKDINWPDGIYCVKPKTYIATLSSNNTLAMRLKILSSYEGREGLASKTKETNQFSVFSKKPKSSSDKSTQNSKLEEQSKKKNFFFFTPMSVKTSRENGLVNEEEKTETQRETSNVFGETSRNVLPKWGNLKLPLQSESIVKVKKTTFSTIQQSTDNISSFWPDNKNAKSHRNESSSFLVTAPGIKTPKSMVLRERQNKNLFRRKTSKITTLVSNKPWGIELPVSTSSYPVEKVNFLIERDDQLGGYRHRIIFEVWTNGSISPRQAIFNSIGWIIKLLYNFREPARTSQKVLN